LVMLQPPTPARESTAWTHAPSQPLMRPLLSQFQAPTSPRRARRFFRVWLPNGLPRRPDHSAYFGLATVYRNQPFQPSTRDNLNRAGIIVNALFWCTCAKLGLHQVMCKWQERPVILERQDGSSGFLHRVFHDTVEIVARNVTGEPNKRLALATFRIHSGF
jgi:hypothetical protein